MVVIDVTGDQAQAGLVQVDAGAKLAGHVFDDLREFDQDGTVGQNGQAAAAGAQVLGDDTVGDGCPGARVNEDAGAAVDDAQPFDSGAGIFTTNQ